MKPVNIGIFLISIGVGLNLLDAYFSGNLPFSPDESDKENAVSKVNAFGGTLGISLALGTILALIGGFVLILSWVSGKKR